LINDYVVELLTELRLPRSRRRRIVAEVEDHLTLAAAELHAAGLDPDVAEREAVRRFGSASELACSFVAQEAAVSGRRVARASGLLGLAFAVLMLGPAAHGFEARPFPHGFVDFVFGQVAFAAATLTLLRAWRATTEGGPTGARLVLVLRGAIVVLACTAVTVAYEAMTSLGARGAGLDGWLVLGLLTAGLVVTVPVFAGAWRLAAASGAADAAPGPGDDALADLAAVVHRVAPRLEVTRTVSRGAARLRAHPWRFALVVAVLAGAAVAAAHGIGEGVSRRELGGALIAGMMIATIEAVTALMGFAVLGRFLAIRAR
jgi:hypothetical protein